MDFPDPCPRCGWKYGGFHVCIELTPAELAASHKRNLLGTMTDAHRVLLSQEKEEARQLRNEEIIRIYIEGNIGMHAIAKEVHVASTTVRKVLKDAEEEGRLRIRRPSHTLAKGAH